MLAPHPGFGSGELAGKRSRRRFATDVGGRWAGWLRRQVHEVGRGDAVAVQYQPGPLVGQLRAAVLGLLGERAGHRSTGCCRVGGVLAQAERAGPMIFRHLVGQLLRPAVRTGI